MSLGDQFSDSKPSAASPFSPASRMPSPAFTMADLRVHDYRSSRSRWPIFAFTMTDLAVHDGPIFAFTMVRNSHYVEEHNSVVPHSAFAGQTPDEMYFGSGDQVPVDLALGRARAREARMKSNRELSCEACLPATRETPDSLVFSAISGVVAVGTALTVEPISAKRGGAI